MVEYDGGTGGSGLVVIAFDNGLTINSGSARTNLTGNITQLSNLDITSSHSTNSSIRSYFRINPYQLHRNNSRTINN